MPTDRSQNLAQSGVLRSGQSLVRYTLPGPPRLTRRAGTAPLAPSAVLVLPPLTPIEDAALRADLNAETRLVEPDEPLLCFLYAGTVRLARRDWSEYRIEQVGYRHDDAPPTFFGPPVYPPEGLEALTGGRRILLLRARIFWRDALVYAELRWRPNPHDPMKPFAMKIKDAEHARNRYELQMVTRGLELLQGIARRGRTPDNRERYLDYCADLARRWVRTQRGKGRDIDDVEWRYIALTGWRSQAQVERKAARVSIGIEDVHQRAREREAWGIEPK